MKILVVVVCVCLFEVGVAHTVHAQKEIAKSSTPPTNSAGSGQQHGLNGQVRRVRVETVALLVKGGKIVEGPRVVRGITTYDARGQRIDSVEYPAEESTVVGNKQQLVHDARGNIVETIMLADDGSILSRVKHDYEFDEFGNWKKMTASVAVYENGKVSYEPFEITNRIITYYYGQPLPKTITAATVPPVSNTKINVSSNRPAEIAKPASDETVNPSATGTSTSGVNSNITAEPPVIGPEKSAASITVPAVVTTKDDKLPTIRVSEEALRQAAIDLPQPQYPEAARLLRAEGIVEVQILVDEKGEVTKASALSGDVLFTELAAEAARKAKFSRAKLSADPAKIYGVINYTFNLPDSQAAASPAAKTTESQQNAGQPNQGISDLKILQPGDAFETDPEPAVETLTPAASFYEKGLGFLASGHNSEAVQALKEATNLDPNNAAAYAKLGIAYTGTRQYREAIVVLKMALRIKPEMVDAEAYYHFSNSYSALGKFSDALQAIQQAIYIKRAERANPETQKFSGFPSFADLHYSAGLTYYNLRRYSGAIEELKQVIALEPKRAQAYYGLALSYIASGDRKSARKQQGILETLDPVFAAKIAKALTAGPNTIQQGFGFIYTNNP